MTTGITPGRATSVPKSHTAAEKVQRQQNKAREHAERIARKRAEKRARDDADRAFFAQWPSSAYPGNRDPCRGENFAVHDCPEIPNAHGAYVKDEEGRPLRASPSEVKDRFTTSWRALFKRWQRMRARFMRMHARTADDKVIIYRTSIVYSDMRWWELRRVARASGWDMREPKVDDVAVREWMAKLREATRFQLQAIVTDPAAPKSKREAAEHLLNSLWLWWTELTFRQRMTLVMGLRLKGIRSNHLWIFQNVSKPMENAA